MIEDKSLLKIDELYEKYNLECSRKAIFNEISKDKDKRKSFFYLINHLTHVHSMVRIN